MVLATTIQLDAPAFWIVLSASSIRLCKGLVSSFSGLDKKPFLCGPLDTVEERHIHFYQVSFKL